MGGRGEEKASMISKIIALCGPGGAGKTSTLKHFADDLVLTGAQQKSLWISTKNKNDVIRILEYHGRRICISSYGDEPAGIKEGYAKAVKSDCDVFITASRVKDKCNALKCVKNLARKSGLSPIYIGAVREPSAKLRAKTDLQRLRVLRVVLEFA